MGEQYVEAGASATDDRRPVFQQMMEDACAKARPFGAVVVHSQSRFFRNALGFAIYEDRLSRAGVKLISIMEPISDDPSGGFHRQILSAVHEFESKKNGLRTLQVMKENARRGFFNGSRAPFGYRTQEVDLPGRRGKKKRLVVNPGEAEIVRKAFELYLKGQDGFALGYLGVVRALNAQGLSYRGREWTRSRVEAVLSNRAYVGEHFFNRKDATMGRRKARAKWVPFAVPAIIEPGVFREAEQRRLLRHSSQVNPKRIGSRTLLTGLVRCGACGAGAESRSAGFGWS